MENVLTPKQQSSVAKLQSWSSELINIASDLLHKSLFLQPLLDNHDVITSVNASRTGFGLTIMRGTLFNACVIDVAKICVGSDKNNASLIGATVLLKSTPITNHLRGKFSEWVTRPSAMSNVDQSLANDSVFIAMMHKNSLEMREQQNRVFDERLKEFLTGIETLKIDDQYKRIIELRHKRVAHVSMSKVGDAWAPFDTKTLGITWGDVTALSKRLERLVWLLYLLSCSTDHAFEYWRKEVEKKALQFWLQKPLTPRKLTR